MTDTIGYILHDSIDGKCPRCGGQAWRQGLGKDFLVVQGLPSEGGKRWGSTTLRMYWMLPVDDCKMANFMLCVFTSIN